MVEPDQPKKETVRIESPLPPATKSPEAPVKPRETVRIELPVRETGNPPIPPSRPADPSSAVKDISSTTFFAPPKVLAASPPLSASPSVSVAPELNEKTVRIPLMPEPLRSSQKKTQPLIAVPQVAPRNPPVAVAPVEKSSMLLYSVLLGVSALILIIQIWIYFS